MGSVSTTHRAPWGVLWTCLAVLAALVGCRQGAEGPDDDDDAWPMIRVNEVVYAHGVEEPEGPWIRSSFWRVPAGDGQVWIRSEIELPSRRRPVGQPLGVRIAALASCAATWDGHPLAGRGRPASRAVNERPGPTSQVLHVADRWTSPGVHDLELRCSAHHRGFEPTTGFWLLAVGDYGTLLRGDRVVSWMALTCLSGMLIVGLYYLVLFALDRGRRPYLLLALLALSGAGLLVAEAWRNVIGYTYDWHIFRLLSVAVLAWSVGFWLLSFLADQFRLKVGRPLAGLAVASITVPFVWVPPWDGKVVFSLLAALLWGLVGCLVAWRRGREGAVWATVGVVGCLLILGWQPWDFVDRNLYLGLALLLSLLLVSQARHVRASQRAAETARLRSVRLEIELLKRHLQPHFLMNTLTALSEWVEQEPATAVRMIEALADELRILGQVAELQRIPLSEELQLCRSHLDVMGWRRDCRYRLQCETERADAEVPPAMLHTLVENAVSHGPAQRETVLRLRQTVDGAEVRYVFDAPFEDEGRGASAVESRRDGTGLRYIKARLTESYGEAWQLRHGPHGEVWRTEILVPTAGRP